MEELKFWSAEREVEWISAHTGWCEGATQEGKLCTGRGRTRVCSERMDENVPASSSRSKARISLEWPFETPVLQRPGKGAAVDPHVFSIIGDGLLLPCIPNLKDQVGFLY